MNRLQSIKIREISLVKRGAVGAARIVLAKADDEDDEPSGNEVFLRMMSDKLDRLVHQGRQPDETIEQATSRMLRDDRRCQELYEEIARGRGMRDDEPEPSELLFDEVGKASDDDEYDDEEKTPSRQMVSKAELEQELEDLVTAERGPTERRHETYARVMKHDPRARSLYEVIQSFDTHEALERKGIV